MNSLNHCTIFKLVKEFGLFIRKAKFSILSNSTSLSKTKIMTLFLFICPMVTFGQLRVTSNGDTYASRNIFIGNFSNFLGTNNNNTPIVFRVNNVLAGNTGRLGASNISFGYNSLSHSSLTGLSLIIISVSNADSRKNMFSPSMISIPKKSK